MDVAAREMLARELSGDGVEFGPGCHPLKVGPKVRSVRYCDAFDRAGFATAFPEVIAEIHGFPDKIDFRLQFDREPFVDQIGRASVDFVVANHLLEHLVNPVRFLEQCYQILVSGGLLFLGLPDKRHIFDRFRARTPLGDVMARYDAGATELTDERIAEFVNGVEQRGEPLRPGDPARKSEFEMHRRRSVHVNVWMLDDVVELLQHLGRRRGMIWALHDGVVGGVEFLLLLRKSARAEDLDLYPSVLGRLHAESNRRCLEQGLADLSGRMSRVEDSVGELLRFVRGCKKVADAVPGGGAVRRWVGRG
jgi:SAM-dependent methyltransferase